MNVGREYSEQWGEGLAKAGLTWEQLLDQARPHIWRWLSRRVADPEVVADLTQDVLVKIWEARGQWNPTRGFWSWLLRITMNHYCDWMERQSQDLLAQTLPLEAYPGQGDLPSQEPSPEEQVIQAEWQSKVRSAVLGLPSKYREVLWLYYFEGLHCAGIATNLGLTVTQVEGRLFRGRSMLKSSLQPFIGGGRR